jgi:hypothetical protein
MEFTILIVRLRVMVFTTTFNNISEKNNCCGQFKYFMLHMCSILDGKIIVGNLNAVLHMCYLLDECSKARCK